MRGVVLALQHADSSPLDCSVRLSVGERFEGTGWIRFSDGEIECVSYNQRDGRITQRVETPGGCVGCSPTRSSGTHC